MNNKAENDATNFSIVCPVFKLNLKDNNNRIAGMYLVANDNCEKLIEEYADKLNLDDDTILYFTQRHSIEVFSILAGVFELTKLDIEKYMEIFSDNLTKFQSVSYKKLKKSTKDFLKDVENKDLMNRLELILNNIWFFPYDKIDTLIRLGIDEFNKRK